MIHINKNSLIDYPGKTAAVLFLPGCNLRCPYCQNPELALAEHELNIQALSEFFSFSEQRKDFLDGVVISGGEPTIMGYMLIEICKRVKKIGYPIKIDTNGTRPDVIRDLIERKLIDYVAVSLKYDLSELDEKFVWLDTLPMLVESGVKFEVRVVAVSDKIVGSHCNLMISTHLSFAGYLKAACTSLRELCIKKLKLHRHNKQAKILNPAFYEGVRMYDEDDYQRLANVVRSQGLQCDVV